MKLHHEELQRPLGVLIGICTAVVPPRLTGNQLPAAKCPLKKCNILEHDSPLMYTELVHILINEKSFPVLEKTNPI
jgi:hypothetical protein